MDCLNCIHSRCINMGTPTLKEYKFSRDMDKEVLKETSVDYGVGSRQNRKPYDVKYYKTHRKEHLQRCKKYRDNNVEKRKETTKKYREKNREVLREKQKQYYQENLEEQRLRKRLYYQQHKEEINRKRKEREKLRNENSENR